MVQRGVTEASASIIWRWLHDAQDHIAVLDRALAQLPTAPGDSWMLARADTAGQIHDFAAALRERGIRFSLGYAVTERVGQAALGLPRRR